VIRGRLEKPKKDYPNGYLTRDVADGNVRQLATLLGHLQAGSFIIKFRKTFTRDEMNDDLEIVLARLGPHEDGSESEEILPSSPP
jgi:hypothetical protein